MNLLLVVRKYFSILVAVMLNLKFLLMLIFSNVLLLLKSQTSIELKMAERAGASKHLNINFSKVNLFK